MNKEILVVSSGESVEDLVKPDRNLHLPGAPTIGRARNAGCREARGEYIAHFDDDDFSAPGRLTDQMSRIGGYAVTGYNSMRFTDGRDWWQYTGARDYALGTSLVYRKDYWTTHNFPEKMVGEDNDFVQKARVEHQIISADAGELMWATIHDRNTSPRNLKGDSYRRCA